MRVSNFDEYLGDFNSIQCDKTMDNFNNVKKHYRNKSDYLHFSDGIVQGKRYESDVTFHSDASNLKELFQNSFKDKKLGVLKKF
eukprot:13442685-Ditylum_brightwellii.AAC.1